ncbi:MAG: sialate O-acetylesterase [Planctomycetota bacterium]
MNTRLFCCVVLVSLVFSFAVSANADVKLPSVFGSNMVLQCDRPVPVWGWAEPGEEVSVRFGSTRKTVKADEQGNWRVTLKKLKASKKRGKQMEIKGKNSSIVLQNILIGDVWVGSGQSNMEWPVRATRKGGEMIRSAKYPAIRLFLIPKVQKGAPDKNVNASWQVCSPGTVPNFSAVLYYFGLKLQTDLKVPIGLIASSWGGSRIEPWTVNAGSNAGGGMYNGMIAPIVPYAIKGAIWYQGESNVGNGLGYHDLKKNLVDGWRRVWKQELPFYYVQIAPWSGYGGGQLPGLWEGQTKSLTIPDTGMAVITDLVDNVGDIHPQMKLEVGRRLALWALARTYGKKKVVFSGPLYKSMEVEGKRIRIHFAHTAGKLGSRDGKALREFQIAGSDGQFVAATAVIDKETVLVSAAGVQSPTQVRFGWHKLANPNLINKAMLPASPFQTNNWSGGTAEKHVSSAPAAPSGPKTGGGKTK